MKYSYETIKKITADSLEGSYRLIIGIDGCCASGKTTLAQRLCGDFEADLIHMDDFFLPPSLRTPARYEEPGGNVHYERFLEQIARPLLNARSHTGFLSAQSGWPVLLWDRFVCSAGAFAPDPCRTAGKPLLIIEGSYSMRPEFRQLYDLTFFLSTSYEEQLRRIQMRSPDRLQMFADKWIPLENRYFSHYQIAKHCLFQICT